MASGLLVLRLVLGLTFVAHGLQKLVGAFGGPGIAGTASYLAGLEFRAPAALAVALGASEIAAGILLAGGLATPLACLVLGVLVLTAIGASLWKRGFWVREGGYEYTLLIFATAVALAMTGPGRFSLDAALGWASSVSGVWWGLGVAAGSGGCAWIVLTAGRLSRRARRTPS